MNYKPQWKDLNVAAALAVTLAVILIFNLLFFNKYFPLSEGWFAVYGMLINSGKKIYSDFHSFLPPLYPYLFSIWMKIFGVDFFTLRILGIVFMLLMATLLFFIFRFFSPTTPIFAALGSIVATMYYESAVTHIAYDFLHVLTLFTLAGAFLLCQVSTSPPKKLVYSNKLTTSDLRYLATGSLFALAFLTKQSNGFMVASFGFLACVFATHERPYFNRYLVRRLGFYCAGLAIPILLCILWLLSQDNLGNFWNSVFVSGAKSKGSIGAILFAWIPRFFTLNSFYQVLVLTSFLISLGYRPAPNVSQTQRQLTLEQHITLSWLTLVLLILAVTIPYFDYFFSRSTIVGNFSIQTYINTNAVGLYVALYFLFHYGRRACNENQFNPSLIFTVCLVTVGLLYGTATSAAISEAATFLPAGLLLVCVLESAVQSTQKKYLFLFAFALTLTLVGYISAKKYGQPYLWWGLSQPDIRYATEKLSLDIAPNFYVSPKTNRIFTEVTQTLRSNVGSEDRIITFPNIPLFHVIASSPPITRAPFHWFDVAPDSITIEDANKILNAPTPPKAIVELDTPSGVWDGHERGFRKGKKSGQRQLLRAIRTLTVSKKLYLLAHHYRLANGYELKVWIRKT